VVPGLYKTCRQNKQEQPNAQNHGSGRPISFVIERSDSGCLATFGDYFCGHEPHYRATRIRSPRWPKVGIKSGIRSTGLKRYASTQTANALVCQGTLGSLDARKTACSSVFRVRACSRHPKDDCSPQRSESNPTWSSRTRMLSVPARRCSCSCKPSMSPSPRSDPRQGCSKPRRVGRRSRGWRCWSLRPPASAPLDSQAPADRLAEDCRRRPRRERPLWETCCLQRRQWALRLLRFWTPRVCFLTGRVPVAPISAIIPSSESGHCHGRLVVDKHPSEHDLPGKSSSLTFRFWFQVRPQLTFENRAWKSRWLSLTLFPACPY